VTRFSHPDSDFVIPRTKPACLLDPDTFDDRMRETSGASDPDIYCNWVFASWRGAPQQAESQTLYKTRAHTARKSTRLGVELVRLLQDEIQNILGKAFAISLEVGEAVVARLRHNISSHLTNCAGGAVRTAMLGNKPRTEASCLCRLLLAVKRASEVRGLPLLSNIVLSGSSADDHELVCKSHGMANG